MQLTIEIGFSDVVEVDQGQATDPTAGQCFSRPRANPTKANNHSVGAAQALDGVVAEQSPDGCKSTVDQGSNTVQPVVRRDSRSMCAC